MSDLKLLKKSRQYIRKQVTESHKNLSLFSSYPEARKRILLATLSDHQKELKRVNSEIQGLIWEDQEDEAAMDTEMDTCQTYFNKIIECIAELQPVSQQGLDLSAARSLLKSPQAPLPVFTSQEGEDLTKFLTQFETAISNFRYTDYDKLQLLKQQVSGRALKLINSLEADKQGYLEARNILEEALASKDVQKFNTIKKITQMKLNYKDDPFDYMCDMKLTKEQVQKLKITTTDFLRYFYWQGLNEVFQTQLVHITQEIRPSLDDILNKYFDASERYMGLQKKFREGKKSPENKESTASLAAKVNFKEERNQSFKPCSICSKIEKTEASHPIYKCLKFSTASEKIAQLSKFNACLKCSHTTHNTDNCRFKFKNKCRDCGGWHFSFLCNKSNEAERSETKDVSCKVVTIATCMQGFSDQGSILPTFTCILENKISVRALKDGGCQCNLIEEQVANKLKLPVLREVTLTVDGMNVSQPYKSKEVKLNIKIGERTHQITAFCLPSLRLDLKLPNLSAVVEEFVRKGFTLCDRSLIEGGDRISNIELLLGASSSYCVPENEIIFGRERISVYSDTHFGILLKGQVEQLRKDIPSLPNLNAKVGSAAVNMISERDKDVEIRSELESSVSDLFRLVPDENQDVNCVLDDEGQINETKLLKATEHALETHCKYFTNLDCNAYSTDSYELNDQMVQFALKNTKRSEEGRLIMPLLWNSKVSHLLGQNFNLSKQILKVNLKKIQRNPTHLKLMNETFIEQEKTGIIERIDDLHMFLNEHPEASFLPHMGVFKLNRETTKCRVVFLSNLCEKDPTKPLTVSHNQSIHAGPSLNQKLSISLLNLRFDSHLLCFDLEKAFNNIALSDIDSNRLLFLWFKNVEKEDFTIVGYRNVRLTFGLRCSPTILLLALYKLLILDAKEDSIKMQNLKKQIYALSYMDNCAVSTNSSEELKEALFSLNRIFNPYHFFLQQFITNDMVLQEEIDCGRSTEEKTPEEVKLLGMLWDRKEDSIYTRPINLNIEASTKRQVLSTIASQFDIYNINCPILNRSRIFMHSLQCEKELGWDKKLSEDRMREWKNIVRQANATLPIKLQRSMGRRDDKYRLIAFSDASTILYGAVIYLQNLRTNEVHFVLAKNRIVNKDLVTKSMPALELHGVSLAVECLADLVKELTSEQCVQPINLVDLNVYSDSLVSLSWLNSYSHKLEKMQKISSFVMNRIYQINRTCEKHAIRFAHVTGIQNPADCVTRCMSSKTLAKTSYLRPNFLDKSFDLETAENILSFTVPNPLADKATVDSTFMSTVISDISANIEKNTLKKLIERASSFSKVVGTYQRVFQFINNIKAKCSKAKTDNVGHFEVKDHNFYQDSLNFIIRSTQEDEYEDLFNYFNKRNLKIEDIPNLVKQLNIFKDENGILRVKHKIGKFKDDQRYVFPILLSKNHRLTKLIIQSYHEKLLHAPCYTVLSELRKTFWIPNHFITVKKILKECIYCKRLNERTVKVNQSDYRKFRLDPPEIPFSYCFLDFWGPVNIKWNGEAQKVWILCITCMWSRAINLKICINQTVTEFIRALQVHGFEYGIPQFCISDLGSQLVAGSNIIQDFLKDPETVNQFERQGIKPLKFDQYFKGCSKLGGMVEICVKMTKRLVFASVKRNILDYRDFEFYICQTVHIVNRRPIGFKEALRDSSGDQIPEPITPELLIKGYKIPSYNIIPEMQHVDTCDPDWQVDSSHLIKDRYHKMRVIQQDLIDSYHTEFLGNLIHQAVSTKDRYKPIKHKSLSIGDIVLIKEVHCKPFNYPMGRIKSVVVNDNNEVTSATIFKGDTREVVKRHSSVIIPLLQANELELNSETSNLKEENQINTRDSRPKRKSALISEEKTKALLDYAL